MRITPLLFALVLFTAPEAAQAFGNKPVVAGDAVDTALANTKPAASAADAAAKCAALAEQSSADTLLIGFEGLLSFDATGTHSAYRRHYERLHSLPQEAAQSGGAGYLLHELLIPLTDRTAAKAEFLVFPETSVSNSAGSVPELCAAAWLSTPGAGGANRKLVILGHSYGGHAANQLATALNNRHLSIDAVYTIDARTKYGVGTLSRTPNAKLWLNFYQTNTPFLNGYVVPGADENKNESSSRVQHTGMPGLPDVFQAVLSTLPL